VGYSYGYNRNEQLKDYKSSHDLILMLGDIVSRGGNLLLDIGPAADGTIPVIMQQRLSDIGDWLAMNGEAIYETEAWRPAQWSKGYVPPKKGASFMANYNVAKLVVPQSDSAYIETFFTKKGNDIYCIVPSYRNTLTVRDLKLPSSATATVLGADVKTNWKQKGKDIVIDLTSLRPNSISSSGIFVVKLKQ
jgi:alpha-L-fucosidase